jgi:hypothetical protein
MYYLLYTVVVLLYIVVVLLYTVVVLLYTVVVLLYSTCNLGLYAMEAIDMYTVYYI